jgi:hypothetical protein
MSVEDVIAGNAEIDEAADGYTEARVYRDGAIHQVFASAAVRRSIEKSGIYRRFNVSKVPIMVINDRVQIVSITTDDVQATAEIDRIRTGNRLHLAEIDQTRNVLTYGDVYAHVLPVHADDTPEPEGEPPPPELRVIWHEPHSVRAIYDPLDPVFPAHVVKSWWEGSGEDRLRRCDLYYHGLVERWTTRPGTDGDRPAHWQEFLEDGQTQWEIIHPYGQPWFHFRTGMPYGIPVHADAYIAQDAVNKLLLTHLSTVDWQAFRQWIALLESNAVLEENTDDPDWEDDADADDNARGDGGVSSGARTGPGSLLTLSGVKSVTSFDPTPPDVFTGPVDLYMRISSLLTGIPLYEFDPSREQPSGIARKRAEAPLISRVGNVCAMLGATHADLWQYILALRGVDAKVEVRWKPAWTVDDSEGWAVMQAKIEAGVPREQVLREAGYSSEQVAEWQKQWA